MTPVNVVKGFTYAIVGVSGALPRQMTGVSRLPRCITQGAESLLCMQVSYFCTAV